MLERLNRKWIGILLVLVVVFLRFPQLYGKNYTLFPDSHYEFTNYNLHATVMNPIWSGRSEDYPVKKEKGAILEGEGTLSPITLQDTRHSYSVNAKTPLHMVDYTFYFPGWNLYVDKQKSTIEYQDPLYRGVITYHLPSGKHRIDLRFEDTTIRKIGKIVTLGSLMFFILLFIFRKQLQKAVSV